MYTGHCRTYGGVPNSCKMLIQQFSSKSAIMSVIPVILYDYNAVIAVLQTPPVSWLLVI